MLRWISGWISRHQEENDLDEELRAHLAIEIQQRIDSGETPAEAARAARRAFGNFTHFEEETRETWGWSALEGLGADLRFGLRMLRKTPVWTTVIALTLAMGVGLSTAIFSVVYGVLLQPLPYPDAGRLVALWPSAPKYGYPRFNVGAAMWLAWQKDSTVTEEIALTRPIANFNLTGDGEPERLQGARTSSNLAQALRVRPQLGRYFTEEEQNGDARVAVLSDAFWRRRFGGDPAIVGRRIQLNGGPFEVIGVMPPDFHYPSADFELWTPLYIPPAEVVHGANYQYVSVARLKQGVSLQQARAVFNAIMHRLSEEHPAAYRLPNGWLGILVEPLAESDAFQVRDPLYVLLGAVACLLAIGCLNLAVLLIARAGARAREMAVRVALGAGSGRLRRQLAAEVVPLAMAGIGGGLLMARGLLVVLVPYLPAGMPRVGSIGFSLPVLGFAAGASLAVILLASLIPARMAARSHPGYALQQSTRSITGSVRTRNLLVVAQVAVALILLFGGSLFARSFSALLRVKPGFRSQGVLTMHLAVTRAKYPTDDRVAAYYDRILGRVRSIPGVVAAGVVNRLPFSGIAQTGSVEFAGVPGNYDSDWRSATPGYFEAIGIPLHQGRAFLETDATSSHAVGIIDERLARRVFGSANPIGRRFSRYLPGLGEQDPWSEIGVAGHIHNDSLERDIRPQVYWPETQHTQDRGALAVRTAGRPESFAPAVIEQIRQENPDQPVYDVRTMEEWVGRTLETRTWLTAMVALFGAASLLLACLGLYGVVSYSANLRIREFGIRMALGARSSEICSLVLRHAGRLAVCGCGAGILICWPVSHALQSLLFGITGRDLLSWLMAPAVLMAVALLSALGPARKAAGADPAVTLRGE